MNDLEHLRDTLLGGDLALDAGVSLAELDKHLLFRLDELRRLGAYDCVSLGIRGLGEEVRYSTYPPKYRPSRGTERPS